MKLTKLTPVTQLCGIGACPAVFRTERGSYVIVGKAVDSSLLPPGQLGDGEQAVEITREMLEEAIASGE